jgi:ethanolamine utilization cobalamin adenosyltransferase
MKSEYMTDLDGNVLVPKTNKRIAFRGFLDTVQAEILEAQALVSERGETSLCNNLDETLLLLRKILGAEVTGKPLSGPDSIMLFGLSLDELHRQTHNVQEVFGFSHPLPVYTMNPSALRLNYLRARIREGELLALTAFQTDENSTVFEREDIITVMNRLSSAFYWLFCKYLK